MAGLLSRGMCVVQGFRSHLHRGNPGAERGTFVVFIGPSQPRPQGRFACLTNVSVPCDEERAGTRSRGDVTTDFLHQTTNQRLGPLDYVRSLDPGGEC